MQPNPLTPEELQRLSEALHQQQAQQAGAGGGPDASQQAQQQGALGAMIPLEACGGQVEGEEEEAHGAGASAGPLPVFISHVEKRVSSHSSKVGALTERWGGRAKGGWASARRVRDGCSKVAAPVSRWAACTLYAVGVRLVPLHLLNTQHTACTRTTPPHCNTAPPHCTHSRSRRAAPAGACMPHTLTA